MSSRLRSLRALTVLATTVALAGCGGSSHQTARRSAAACGALRLATQGATQGVLVNVSLENTGGKACRLRGPLEVSLRQPDGSLADAVHGNPASVPLRARLEPGRPVERSWSWRNWCGRGSKLMVVARAGAAQAHKDVTAPVCVEQAAGSSFAPAG